MSQAIQATIILPTTADRGLLLPLCIRSIQQQTLQAFELFIIGDGVDEPTRSVIKHLMAQDNRIRFFDHPKHERRGEVYRHQALQQAQGFFVAYICDRDLWLPNHLDALSSVLQEATLATTNYYFVRRNQQLLLPYLPSSPRQRARGILSATAHRLDFYRQLPYGWRTTPSNQATDLYMWDQLLAHPNCRVAMVWQPTLLYFKRNNHPGWPTAQRYEELARWDTIRQNPERLQSAMNQAFINLIYERNQFKESWFLVRGRRISELPRWFMNKLRWWLTDQTKSTAEESWLPDPIKLD
ncbi:glycosyltransferase family 2 protein [Spirosoma aerolatum]|uniref:glycosyltransferase family 2 protein n=1 Tax=Spirosoma aerolatum TaxID=1211326 RepID=UPI0009AEEF46|nr:glycosyltransferase family A protein [Spirosoma aerolatum]